jgi:hypothetical protein
MPKREHNCVNGRSTEESWWMNDAQGIPLRRVCSKCQEHHKKKYRPEILSGYDQAAVDESIEENY